MSVTDDDSDDGRKISFLESYKTADVAEKCLRERFSETDLIPTSYGIDRRHEELSSEDIDGRPDLKVSTSDANLRAFLEVKSKRNEDWMLVTNQYAFDRYVSHAQTYREPTWIVWTLMDGDTAVDHQFVEVEDFNQVERTFTAPDQTTVVKLSEDDAVGFGEFITNVTENTNNHN